MYILQNTPNPETATVNLLSAQNFLTNDSGFRDTEFKLKLYHRFYTLNDYIEIVKNYRKKKELKGSSFIPT